jgi:hypothetical protein
MIPEMIGQVGRRLLDGAERQAQQRRESSDVLDSEKILSADPAPI